MTAKWHAPKRAIYLLISVAFLAVGSGGLLGCKPQPDSMFEQQAEAKSTTAIDPLANPKNVVAVDASASPSINNPPITAIHITKQQAIAQQPNCNPTLTDCQYFELNILDFSPAQPWLTRMMWQTIARVLAPETPLASQDETAKKTVSMLFNQIEYSEQGVATLPMYQRIDTALVLNPVAASGSLKQSLIDNKTNHSADITTAVNNPIATGYLMVRASQHRGGRQQQQLNYVMLDMHKKLQLTIDDILLPDVTTEALLLAFQSAKKDWLTSQNIEQKYHEDWPLPLSRQWYLDAKGLHMVYQSGELLDVKTDAVDLIVPYPLLRDLIKPNYIVQIPLDAKS